MSSSNSTSSSSSSSSSDTEAPVPFFLAPTFDVGEVIDYSTVEGRKYFERCVAKVMDEGFDVEESDRMVFTSALLERAREVGWDIDGVGITSIFLKKIKMFTY